MQDSRNHPRRFLERAGSRTPNQRTPHLNHGLRTRFKALPWDYKAHRLEAPFGVHGVPDTWAHKRDHKLAADLSRVLRYRTFGNANCETGVQHFSVPVSGPTCRARWQQKNSPLHQFRVTRSPGFMQACCKRQSGTHRQIVL